MSRDKIIVFHLSFGVIKKEMIYLRMKNLIQYGYDICLNEYTGFD